MQSTRFINNSQNHDIFSRIIIGSYLEIENKSEKFHKANKLQIANLFKMAEVGIFFQ
jgi:hypothetical protein